MRMNYADMVVELFVFIFYRLLVIYQLDKYAFKKKFFFKPGEKIT